MRSNLGFRCLACCHGRQIQPTPWEDNTKQGYRDGLTDVLSSGDIIISLQGDVIIELRQEAR